MACDCVIAIANLAWIGQPTAAAARGREYDEKYVRTAQCNAPMLEIILYYGIHFTNQRTHRSILYAPASCSAPAGRVPALRARQGAITHTQKCRNPKLYSPITDLAFPSLCVGEQNDSVAGGGANSPVATDPTDRAPEKSPAPQKSQKDGDASIISHLRAAYEATVSHIEDDVR